MTSYFDEASHNISECSHLPDDRFLDQVADIENSIIRDVNLVTGDKQFPDDLREKIQTCIAVRAYNYLGYVNEKAKEWILYVRSSRMIDSLHSLFHEVAGRGITTRFGFRIGDNPDIFLKLRDSAIADGKL